MSEAADMAENITAVLHHYQLPELPINTQYPDRVFWEPTPEWFDKMRELVSDDRFRIWNAVSNHGPSAMYGYRENVLTCSVQIIIHGTGEEGTDQRIEGDVDEINPDYGAGAAIAHLFIDVILKWCGRKPSAKKIRAKLKSRGIKFDMEKTK